MLPTPAQVVWDVLLQWLSMDKSVLQDEALVTLAIIARQHCTGPTIQLQTLDLWTRPAFHQSLSPAAALFCSAMFSQRKFMAKQFSC